MDIQMDIPASLNAHNHRQIDKTDTDDSIYRASKASRGRNANSQSSSQLADFDGCLYHAFVVYLSRARLTCIYPKKGNLLTYLPPSLQCFDTVG